MNLQHAFNAIVHYDLAWNPTRHEQREGRVDRFGQRSDEVRVVTIYGQDNGIDGKVLEVLIKKHREIRKSTGISVPVPDETSSQVTGAIVEWLLMRDRGDQQALFGLDEVIGKADEELEVQWSSMAERETRSRSRYAQGSVHPDEVAREVEVIREALGRDEEVRAFTQTALKELGADITTSPGGEFTVTTKSLPAGLEDSIAALIGERPKVPFRVTPPSRVVRPPSPAPTPSSARLPTSCCPPRWTGTHRPSTGPPAAAASSRPAVCKRAPRCCSSATATRWYCPDGSATCH